MTGGRDVWSLEGITSTAASASNPSLLPEDKGEGGEKTGPYDWSA